MDDIKKYIYGTNAGNQIYIAFDKDSLNETGELTREFTSDSTDDLSLSALKIQMETGFNEIKDKVDNHDTKMSRDHKALNKKIDQLERENRYFREELSTINSPEKLSRWSLYVAIFTLCSLGISLFSGIHLLHPAFGAILLITSLVFHIMSIVMKKEG